jgi:DNA-binding transcriptional ArsR family regulator
MAELSGMYGSLMGTDFAAVGRLLSSPARAAMLEVLLDGGTASASDLAAAASVKPSTASGHLAALVDGRIVDVSVRGRHRDYRLANRDVALALEALSRICPDRRVHSLKTARTMDVMRVARTCYDHLAGALGAALCRSVLAAGWACRRHGDRGLLVTAIGATQLHETFGIALAVGR